MDKKVKIAFPQKNDYPDNLEILKTKRNSKPYFQLVESSASAYFETNMITRYFFLKRFYHALSLIPKDKTYDFILDAGCGIGFFLPILSQIGKQIVAVDNAPYSIEYAKYMCQKRKIGNVTFQKTEIDKSLPFFENKFDLVVCLSVLEHIKDLDRVFLNFLKVLKDDGFLMVGYPNENNIAFRIVQYLEKRILRPKVFKTFQGTKLIHRSTANRINNISSKYFITDEEKNINLLPGIDFYILRRMRPPNK